MTSTGSPDRPGPPSPQRARIQEVRPDGLWVARDDGARHWLPAEEWSFSRDAWKTALPGLSRGVQVDVVPWGIPLGTSLQPVSRRRAGEDPWHSVSDDWMATPRSFVVTRLTRRKAFGEIEPGLEGSLVLDRLRTWLTRKGGATAWESHAVVAVGDTVAGLVEDIVYPGGDAEPEVVLDPRELSEAIEKDPRLRVGTAQLAPARDSLVGDEGPATSPLDGSATWNVLLVDNDKVFGPAAQRALESRGLSVTLAQSQEAALRVIDEAEPHSLDLALVDLHLIDGENTHNGFEVARALAARHPACPIVLLSGEELSPVSSDTVRTKLEQSKDIEAAAFLRKPMTPGQLHAAISRAMHKRRPRPVVDLVGPHLGSPPRASETAPSGRDAETVSRDRSQVNEALDELGKSLPGAVIHVFAMHPLTLIGRSIAHVGNGLEWEKVQHKLGKSPVRDTAVDKSRAVWNDEDVTATILLQAKHLWLREAMPYHSALGVPIETELPWRHCLLAFHAEPKAFGDLSVARARLCAERVARALENVGLLRQAAEGKRFETAGMVFACLAHELRNSLSGVSAQAELLEEALKPGSAPSSVDLPKTAASIREGVDRSIRIAQTFNAPSAKPAAEPIDVAECLEDAIRAARAHIPEGRDIEISRELIPPATCLVRADPANLTLALFNLLLNAVQQVSLFVRRRGLVWIVSRREPAGPGRWLTLLVNDTGPGIHACDHMRIFDPRYSTRPDGTGMGLAICRRALEDIRDGNRKGSVQVHESVLGAGTAFEVRLPLTEPPGAKGKRS